MNFFTIVFLGVVMLIVNTFAAPLSEEMQERGERSDMHTREERSDMHTQGERSDMHTQGDRSEMHTRGENDMQNVERGSECQAPWKAIDGFQKCYLFRYSDDEVVQYINANDFCIHSKPGARLFTPGSLDEMKQVEAAFIPASVAGYARFYWTGYVEYAWQLASSKGPLQYAANSFPFEPVPKELWVAGQPEDHLPHQEPCTFGTGGGIGDTGCVDDTWFAGHCTICEAAWTLEPAWNSPTARRGANMMQNGQERAENATMMQNGQERGQANLMQNAQEQGQANLMQNAQERGQANLMHNAQERGQAKLMHNAQERGQADERR